MVDSDSKHIMQRNYSETKSAICLTLLVILSFFPLNSLVFAQDSLLNDENVRILVLHGAWHEEPGVRRFDQALSERLTETLGDEVEVSFKNLELNLPADSESYSRYKQSIATLIQLERPDLMVAVFPGAINFVKELGVLNSLPAILLSPSDSFAMSDWEDRNIHVVRSNANNSIRMTLMAAMSLNPAVNKVEIIAGDGVVDQSSLDRTLAIIEDEFPTLEANELVALKVSDLVDHVSQLSNDSVVLTLPFTSYQDQDGVVTTNFTSQITDASSVPVYGYVNSLLFQGIAGGYITTADDLASSTLDAVLMLRDSQTQLDENSVVDGGYIFDYEASSKWNLDFSAMNEPYLVLNEPVSLIDEFFGFVVAIGILVLLLSAALVGQFYLLQRSRSTQKALVIKDREAKESALRFELLSENSPDVIWTWDGKNQRLTYISPAIFKMTGYTVKEFSNFSLMDVMTKDSAGRALELSDSNEVRTSVFEIDLVSKEGKKIPCEIAARKISTESSGNNEWVGVTRDISLRKHAEEEREKLEIQVRQSQKFESLGTLAGGIAHDFNNMLAVVLGLSELLKLKISENKSALEIVDKLMSTSENAKELVSQILTFSRQTGGNKDRVNLVTVINNSTQIAKSGFGSGVQVDLQINEDTAEVIGNSNELSQMIVSVLSNAYEAIDERGGAITIALDKMKLTSQKDCLHGQLDKGDYIKITISDTGVGLAKERIENLFDPFYTSKDMGSGMGLAIVRGIVLDHNGGIDLESEPFQGSSFYFYLPIAEEDPQISAQANSAESVNEKSTILLIDDQPDLLEIVGLMLGELGHECIQCSNPQEALNLISERHVELDLVITDFSMPEVSGLDVLKHCETLDSNLPVVIATGYDQTDSLNALKTKIHYSLLPKPFGLNDLRGVLQKVL